MHVSQTPAFRDPNIISFHWYYALYDSHERIRTSWASGRSKARDEIPEPGHRRLHRLSMYSVPHRTPVCFKCRTGCNTCLLQALRRMQCWSLSLKAGWFDGRLQAQRLWHQHQLTNGNHFRQAAATVASALTLIQSIGLWLRWRESLPHAR